MVLLTPQSWAKGDPSRCRWSGGVGVGSRPSGSLGWRDLGSPLFRAHSHTSSGPSLVLGKGSGWETQPGGARLCRRVPTGTHGELSGWVHGSPVGSHVTDEGVPGWVGEGGRERRAVVVRAPVDKHACSVARVCAPRPCTWTRESAAGGVGAHVCTRVSGHRGPQAGLRDGEVGLGVGGRAGRQAGGSGHLWVGRVGRPPETRARIRRTRRPCRAGKSRHCTSERKERAPCVPGACLPQNSLLTSPYRRGD